MKYQDEALQDPYVRHDAHTSHKHRHASLAACGHELLLLLLLLLSLPGWLRPELPIHVEHEFGLSGLLSWLK